MTKRYDAQDLDNVVTAVRRFYEDKRTSDADPDTVEIHNHLPADDYTVSGDDIAPSDEEADENGVIARYPASYHAVIEGDRLVIYQKAPDTGSDRYEFKPTHDRHPPRTLAELNRFFAGYYPRRRTTAAR